MPMRSPREAALVLLLRLRPSEWQKTLVFAAAIGVTGALATIGFRQSVLFAEQLMFGRNDSLVRIAAGLVWWQRLAVPAIGGVVAGLFLMWSRRVGSARAGGDYMEAISLGSGDLPVRVSVARAL